MAAKKAKAEKAAPKAEEKKVQAAAEVKQEAKKAAPAKTTAKPEAKAVKKEEKTSAPKKYADKKPAVKKAAVPKKAEPAQKAAAPKETNIFNAIKKADLASFTALVKEQKNKRGEYGRTPLMTVCLIRSNPRMTDGSNYETKRVTTAKEIYDKMYQLLIDAGCDTNAMDDAGNTAREYNYGGILNQMLAD